MKADRDRFLTQDDFRRLLQAAKKSRNPDRDYMLFCLAGNLGLRVSEVTRLCLGDFHLRGDPFLRVRTAKQKEKTQDDLPLHPALERAVKLYVVGLGRRARIRFERQKPFPALVKGRSTLCLFPGAISPWHPMTTRTAEKAFKQAAGRAGLRPDVSFHALRHYRGVRLYSETRDVLVVKRFLRHRSLHSSFVYMHLDPETSSLVNSRVGSVT